MVLRRALAAASRSDDLRRLATETAAARQVAYRFVAGETLDDAVGVARDLNRRGIRATLDHLGEAVEDEGAARRHADAAVDILDRIEREDLDCTISVKPTALGLSVDPALARELAGKVCAHAAAVDRHVTLDMEGSEHTQGTVDLLVHLIEQGHDNVGCAVQAYLHRTVDDVRHLTGMGASLRICKGAYAEPEEIAYQEDAEVADNFVRAAEVVLNSDTYGRFATHDLRVISRVLNLARRFQVPRDRYEWQMLYGVREPLQDRLVERGHDVRVYVPYGSEWYPYLVRRLAERPANLRFFLRALLGAGSRRFT